MASFYGGSPGLSMMIVKSYPSLEALKKDFKLPDCTVGIGECVCIDSGLNDGKHGNIYRRTTDPNSPEYVGNMSGPMGPGITFGAKININTTSDINSQINTALGSSLESMKTKNILCEDQEGKVWIYAYNYATSAWFMVANYNRYIISSTMPNSLTTGGLWLITQETSGNNAVLNAGG